MVAQEPMQGSEGLHPFIPLLETDGQDREIQLPQELKKELARITSEFTVDTSKLKDIVKHFGKELDQGLKKTHQNIVILEPHVVAKELLH